MQYKPIFNYRSKVMIVDLKKPIYGSFYGIWNKWLKMAHNNGMKIVVNTQEGKSTYKSADEYINGAERLERYYKNPNEPMIFYGRHFKPDVDDRKKRKKLEKKHIVEDVRIPSDVWEKLKPRAKQLGLI